MIDTKGYIYNRNRGRQRRGFDMRGPIFVILMLAMVLGISIYFRLWVIQSEISSVDAESLRRQFDLANREAMDESAEWRYKFDQEFERANTCSQNLLKMKESLEKNPADNADIDKKLEMLQKENMDLLERVESLKQELEDVKLKCKAKPLT